MLRYNLVGLIWLIVGVVLAANRHYLNSLHTVRQLGSAALAIVLWPLLLLGINLHIH
jgi:hypothetical protein